VTADIIESKKELEVFIEHILYSSWSYDKACGPLVLHDTNICLLANIS